VKALLVVALSSILGLAACAGAGSTAANVTEVAFVLDAAPS
jgi:hypothetical protein